MTRLRFNLNDVNKAQVDEIKKLKGVQGVVNKNGQFQIIIGTQVNKVCDELHKLGNFGENSSSDSEDKETGVINKILGAITAIFTPVIPALAGSGMIKALLAILKLLGIVSVDSQTYTYLSFLSDTVFYFLPVILAYSAAKRFKCSPYLAAVLGASLLHPSFSALLIHVRLDTVKLDGKHFTPHIKQGDKINVGDLLIEFDKDAIKEAGYELDTDVIVTNTNDY